MKVLSKNTVAMEIFNQLGGNKFVAMTGAYSFSCFKNEISFRIGKNAKKIKAVGILLNDLDLYDVKFYRQAPNTEVTFEEIKDVYAEDLQKMFTDRTGLYTNL